MTVCGFRVCPHRPRCQEKIPERWLLGIGYLCGWLQNRLVGWSWRLGK